MGFNNNMRSNSLQIMRADSYFHVGVIGWITYALLLIMIVIHTFSSPSDVSHTEFIITILAGFIWWQRPQRECRW